MLNVKSEWVERKQIYMDGIFTLTMINEKIWEHDKKIDYLFVDFQKAYDSIHRDSLWKIMREFQIPLKLINMCKICIGTHIVKLE